VVLANLGKSNRYTSCQYSIVIPRRMGTVYRSTWITLLTFVYSRAEIVLNVQLIELARRPHIPYPGYCHAKPLTYVESLPNLDTLSPSCKLIAAPLTHDHDGTARYLYHVSPSRKPYRCTDNTTEAYNLHCARVASSHCDLLRIETPKRQYWPTTVEHDPSPKPITESDGRARSSS